MFCPLLNKGHCAIKSLKMFFIVILVIFRIDDVCPDGVSCDYAHSPEELQEWIERRDFLRQKLAKAREDMLIMPDEHDFGKYNFLLQGWGAFRTSKLWLWLFYALSNLSQRGVNQDLSLVKCTIGSISFGIALPKLSHHSGFKMAHVFNQVSRNKYAANLCLMLSKTSFECYA